MLEFSFFVLMEWVFYNTNKMVQSLEPWSYYSKLIKLILIASSEVNNHYTKSSIEWSQYSMVKITQQQVGGPLVCQKQNTP